MDGPSLVTRANEYLFPKSLRNLAHSTSDKAFFCHLMANQSPVVTRQRPEQRCIACRYQEKLKALQVQCVC